MKSINFPKMFNTNSTNIIRDKEATRNNLKYLLLSERGELLGDVAFGVALKRYMFEQNNTVIRDILIDEIYNQIALFMPQLQLTRNDITITHSKGTLYANIRALNKIDYTTDMYNIVLFQERE